MKISANGQKMKKKCNCFVCRHRNDWKVLYGYYYGIVETHKALEKLLHEARIAQTYKVVPDEGDSPIQRLRTLNNYELVFGPVYLKKCKDMLGIKDETLKDMKNKV